MLHILLELFVVLQKFDAEKTGADFIAEAVFVQFGSERLDVLFKFFAMIDMDVAGLCVASLEYFNYLVE